eukprot:CAMPEP_0180667080 /NCGR_PEP_ID=MMETSP1037_2-20121125/62170_1 /TAXON_ID=632150 /ORGANISM="Azadinium spinosum, Strain 3D9" /LENGTH=150 /DNA_ID=CAMNT_0022695657 /DNA_START=70 /DNA_END=521 /DNA_ORIENTATION=+
MSSKLPKPILAIVRIVAVLRESEVVVCERHHALARHCTRPRLSYGDPLGYWRYYKCLQHVVNRTRLVPTLLRNVVLDQDLQGGLAQGHARVSRAPMPVVPAAECATVSHEALAESRMESVEVVSLAECVDRQLPVASNVDALAYYTFHLS